MAARTVAGRNGGMLLLACAALMHAAQAFYLPGVAPREYEDGEKVEIKVSGLTSVKAQMPYEYYSLPFCSPEKKEYFAENIGEILQADRIENSPYDLQMNEEKACEILCTKKYTSKEIAKFVDRIQDDYYINWIVDNLPVARRMLLEAPDQKPVIKYEKGFPIGYTMPGESKETAYIHNHVRLNIKYHKDPKHFKGSRIVGFEIEPFSVKHECRDGPCPSPITKNKLRTCTPTQPVSHTMPPMAIDKDSTEIIFTYDVRYEPSDIRWASRWDMYLLMNDDQIHWFSIINSLMIVVFLTGMVAMIMVRTLRRDFVRYNELETTEEMQEETGWKYIHADVFRPPAFQVLFSILVGTGVQVFGMTMVTMGFAILGFLSPSNRGGLMTAVVLLFVFMGAMAGYYASRIYKMFVHQEFQFYKEPPADSLHWKKMTFGTATLIPSLVFLVFFILDLVLWSQQSSGAIPFTTMLALGLLWFCISVPLVFLGSYFGFKAAPVENPTKTNLIPRAIPPQTWYMHPLFSFIIGGLLPFGAVFIELFFIMSSLWRNEFYYLFGFLFLVLVILFVTCAEVTIVLCYFQLCGEDYNWWWRSYLTSGASAVYLFGYSVLFFYTRLEIVKFVSGMMYFGYMFIVSLLFFVLTGTVGFYSTFWFVRTIYAAVKVD